MLPKYAHMGQSLKLVGGRISVLGCAVLGFALMAGSGVFWILQMETSLLNEVPLSLQSLYLLMFSWLIKKWVGHWLFKPLPVMHLPSSWKPTVELPLRLALLIRLPLLACSGFGWGTPWRSRDHLKQGKSP